jgi:hypothetical protein
MRFHTAQFGLTEPFDFNLVFPAALLESSHARILEIISGHQQFAASQIGQFVLPAQIMGEFRSALAEVCFETARLIIDASMDDT